jgi:ribosomal protein S18 acetylase RimI-like enzyme
MPTGSSVRKATLADAPRLAQALASAFQDDPVIAWIFPDEHRRRGLLPAFMEFRLRKLAFPHDEVWMTAGGAAAAVWFPPPGRWQLSRAQRLRLLPPLVRFFGLRTASVLGGLERMEKQHPQDRSHWYLFILGTEPAAQGQGLGSALLAQMLARVDADGMPAYLESSSDRNLALYGRHGFQVTSELVIPAARGSGRCVARPELERVITEVRPASRRHGREPGHRLNQAGLANWTLQGQLAHRPSAGLGCRW